MYAPGRGAVTLAESVSATAAKQDQNPNPASTARVIAAASASAGIAAAAAESVAAAAAKQDQDPKSSFRIRCFRRLRRIHSCYSRSYFHIHSRCCCRHNRYCRRIRSRLLLNHSCLFASKLVFMVYTMPYSMSVFPVVLPFFKIFFYSSFRQGCADLSSPEGPGAFPYLWKQSFTGRKIRHILIEKGR